MPTIIDLSPQELAELKSFTKEADDAAAVRSAMKEYLRLARRMQLKTLSGRVAMDENWPALETAEQKDFDDQPGPGTH
jgi:hypothetical protein